MSVNKRVTIILSALTFILSAISTMVVLGHYGTFGPRPYWVKSFDWVIVEGGYINFHAEFAKYECTYDRMVARGIFLGVVDPAPIPMRDLDGDQGDREEGLHSADFVIGPMRQDYEAVEIRTRHICDGKRFDRVFARIELK